jgi:hypothetical protein
MARLLILACALAASLAAHARTDVAPGADADYAPRLIVKFRSASAESPAARVAKLALETGVPLAHGRTMGIGAEVLTSPAIRSQADADAMAALLARHPDVAYAERSRRVHAERMPNDPLFPQQFYLATGAGHDRRGLRLGRDARLAGDRGRSARHRLDQPRRSRGAAAARLRFCR